jgi:hypothetical protein
VARVRDWLRTESDVGNVPGGRTIYERYVDFRRDLPVLCRELRLDVDALTFTDLSDTISVWLRKHR